MKPKGADIIWRIYENVNKMIISRGFQNKHRLTKTSFNSLISNASFSRSKLDFVAERAREDKLKIMFWENKIGVVAVRAILKSMEKYDIAAVMIISKDKMTARGKKAVSEINRSLAMSIEHFTDDEVSVDITEHQWMSPHRIMSNVETKELLERYKVELQYLPKILKTDAMCRYIGGNVGQCIEIIRTSETAGTSLYYRVVV